MLLMKVGGGEKQIMTIQEDVHGQWLPSITLVGCIGQNSDEIVDKRCINNGGENPTLVQYVAKMRPELEGNKH